MAMLESLEPATGALLWRGTAGDVEAEVAALAQGWTGWAAEPLGNRIEALRRFANLLRQREEEAVNLIARETGRPLWDARGEVSALADLAGQCIVAYSERSGQKRVDGAMGTRQTIHHRPIGPLAVIAPYSAPMLTPGTQMLPALLAGNGVAFKPSERVPASSEWLVKLLWEAGVPQGALRCIQGGGDIGAALAADERLAGLLFAGSIHTGLSLQRSLGRRPDRMLMLEMGGNNPLILWDTPDIPSTVALTVQSAFLSTGQRRMAGRRLILRQDMADMVIDELRRLVARLVIDHPHAERAPFMGPVIDMATADGLTESYLYLMSNGGRPITHMRRPQPERPFITPGIIDVTGMAERPDIELFGPILQIVRVTDFDAALKEANATRFGLAAALFGGTETEYERFRATSNAGQLFWNRPTTHVPPAGPVAGTGLSGNHRPGGSYTAHHVSSPVVALEAPQPRFALGIGLDIDAGPPPEEEPE